MKVIRDVYRAALTLDTSGPTALALFPGAVVVVDTNGVWCPDEKALRELRDACDAVLTRLTKQREEGSHGD